MMTNSSRFTVPLYFVAAIFAIWGISLNFVDEINPGDFRFVLPFIVVFNILFIVFALKEVMGSTKIDSRQKWFWTICLVAFNLVAGLVYALVARDRVVGDE